MSEMGSAISSGEAMRFMGLLEAILAVHSGSAVNFSNIPVKVAQGRRHLSCCQKLPYFFEHTEMGALHLLNAMLFLSLWVEYQQDLTKGDGITCVADQSLMS